MLAGSPIKHTSMKKKTSDILKELEQMHRDKRRSEEIYTTTMRYREFAEAEEAADSQKPEPMPKIKIDIGKFKRQPI